MYQYFQTESVVMLIYFIAATGKASIKIASIIQTGIIRRHSQLGL
jgi:hypothetical protein